MLSSTSLPFGVQVPARATLLACVVLAAVSAGSGCGADTGGRAWAQSAPVRPTCAGHVASLDWPSGTLTELGRVYDLGSRGSCGGF